MLVTFRFNKDCKLLLSDETLRVIPEPSSILKKDKGRNTCLKLTNNMLEKLENVKRVKNKVDKFHEATTQIKSSALLGRTENKLIDATAR